MPELPEVATIVSDLNKKVKGDVILSFWSDWPKLIKQPKQTTFNAQIKNLRIKEVIRIGKNIIFLLSHERALLIHQKMTGHLMVGQWEIKNGKALAKKEGPLRERVNQYIHALFYLKSGKMIALSDMRKFARMALGKESEILSLKDIATLGPDALDPKLTLDIFSKRITSRKKVIKTTLMDPTVVAGIGNIYADDILWSARVHPLKRANTLSQKEVQSIYVNTKKILRRAIEMRGTSAGDYRDTAGEKGLYGQVILAYRRHGKPCKRCKTILRRIKVGQRSAHFCPQCQKL